MTKKKKDNETQVSMAEGHQIFPYSGHVAHSNWRRNKRLQSIVRPRDLHDM